MVDAAGRRGSRRVYSPDWLLKNLKNSESG
jgi:hypothetical protein